MRSRICTRAKLVNTVMIGADAIESDALRAENASRGAIDLGVGDGSTIIGAIVDKDCRIGRGVHIENTANVETATTRIRTANRCITFAMALLWIPRGVTIPDGMRIPELTTDKITTDCADQNQMIF